MRANIFGINVPNALHEIDRKMLCSFSLDSFSDRQQLFLYFIRAEATVPLVRRRHGSRPGPWPARAVALVWRDPYPRGFVKDNDDDNANDAMDKDEDWYPDGGYKDPWRRIQAAEAPRATRATTTPACSSSSSSGSSADAGRS